jgi:hypothetical protein
MLQEVLYLGSEHRLRRLFSSICVQDLYRATPALFRTQIEQLLEKKQEIQLFPTWLLVHQRMNANGNSTK